MRISWEDSGDRALKLTLEDVQQLALGSGYVFPNTSCDMPLARRANLPALFNDFNVNSTSAFIRLFTSKRLCPPGVSKPGTAGTARLTGTLIDKPEPPTWVMLETGSEVYVGQTYQGLQHGSGIHFIKGPPAVLYVGGFQEGRRHGLGEVHTGRGEAFQGYFEEGIMMGPACYSFPRVQPSGGDSQGEMAAKPPRAKSKFEGMFNGWPQGKGVLTWEDGEEEAGEFEGSTLLRPLPWQEVEGVLLAAASNAQQAMAQAEAITAELQAQPGGLWEQAVQHFGQVWGSVVQYGDLECGRRVAGPPDVQPCRKGP